MRESRFQCWKSTWTEEEREPIGNALINEEERERGRTCLPVKTADMNFPRVWLMQSEARQGGNNCSGSLKERGPHGQNWPDDNPMDVRSSTKI